MTEKQGELRPGEMIAERIWGQGYGSLLGLMVDSYDPGLTEHLVSFFENTYARPALDVKTRQICTLCALACMGMAPEMLIHFRGSLNLGWTQQEIREALMITVFTAGIPKTLNAFKSFHEVLGNMKVAPETDPFHAHEGKIEETGLRRGNALLGDAFAGMVDAVRIFHPPSADYLVSSIFGRILARPHLTDRVRALILVASCTVMRNISLLRALLPASERAGATRGEMEEIIYQMHGYAGWPACLEAMEAYCELFPRRGTGK
jgi:4-carboxymuconolactone decarboxylase